MDKLQLRGVLTLVLALGLVTSAEGNCFLDVGTVIPKGFKHPLLVHEPSPGFGELLHPELSTGPNAILRFNIPDNANLTSSCLGNPPDKYMTCKNERLVFSQNPNSKVDWEDLQCSSLPRAIIEKQGNVCGYNGVTYRIGWKTTSNLSIPLIDICFDANTETTQFTQHKIQGRYLGGKMVSLRPAFRADHEGMFSVKNVKKAYTKKSVVPLFMRLLGTNTCLTNEGQNFLAKGHLTPDADFFYTAEQAATYFYANAVPQWQCANNCNWKTVETDIRLLAKNHEATFRVWTGTYGTLQFPDANNNAVSMFLGLGLTENKRVIPIPAVMWKVIQNTNNNETVAFFQINDNKCLGSSKEINLNEPPCNNVCDQLGWINNSKLDDKTRGRTFCCSVSDLRTKIPILPDLGIVGLLKN